MWLRGATWKNGTVNIIISPSVSVSLYIYIFSLSRSLSLNLFKSMSLTMLLYAPGTLLCFHQVEQSGTALVFRAVRWSTVTLIVPQIIYWNVIRWRKHLVSYFAVPAFDIHINLPRPQQVIRSLLLWIWLSAHTVSRAHPLGWDTQLWHPKNRKHWQIKFHS